MGWDSFGLPAEQYAIQTDSIRSTTEDILALPSKWIKLVSVDWDHEVRTSNPDYYKWTQCIFIQILIRG